MREHETIRQIPQTEVQQPDPMLDEQQPGLFRIGFTMLGAATVVVLVLYGLSRPAQEPTQTASTPEASQTTGQADQAQPSTTGQGQSASDNKAQPAEPPAKSARSDSATAGTRSAPSDKAAPDAAKK